jgi:hypothetical protein
MVLSQGTCIWNTKSLSFTIQKMWPKLKFLKSRSNFKVRRSKIKFSIERTCRIEQHNMESQSLTIQKLWPMLKLSKSRSNFKVKVNRPKIMVPIERSCQKKTHIIDWLVTVLCSLNNFHLHVYIWKHYRWRAAKSRSMLGTQSIWAGRDLYRATPA